MDYKKLIAGAIKIDGITQDEIEKLLVKPQEAANGEYSLPCFRFAKILKSSPAAIAENIKNSFPTLKEIEKVDSVNGYLNFKLSRKGLVEDILLGLNGFSESSVYPSNNKSICIDYSSINIAKPFHIGHLLTTAIGGSLYKIFEYLGYKVVGINHLGDWGTQFGKLISAYKRWGNDADIAKRNINALLDLYVKFHDEAEKDNALNDEARAWFKKIEDGNVEALKIFQYFKDVTLKEVDKVYARLGVHFDSYNGESFYNDKMQPVIKALEDKKLLTVSEGARVVNLDNYDMPPCLVQKSDGASLYATRDLAAAIYRKETYNFEKCLYVVAYQQNLHFKQLFKVLELMDYDWAKDCVHVPFGMVSLEGVGALSTRKGNVVFLSDVIETAVNKTRKIIEDKNPDTENKEEIAEWVGVGSVLFMALSSARIKDMSFSYDAALNFDGETSPYIQYTHARCCSLLTKATAKSCKASSAELTDDVSFELIKVLGEFNEAVEQAAAKYEPCVVAKYLIDLSRHFNKFYLEHKIGDNETRLFITDCVRKTLKKGLALLLIKAPEKM